jgi:hypothetical protein
MPEVEAVTKRPPPPPPQVLALNVCDWIWTDPWSQKKTMIGMFSVVQAQQFPAVHPVLTIHAALTNGRGKVSLKVKLVDTDEERAAIIDNEAHVEFPDPRAIMDFVSTAVNIVFVEPGEYRVQLFANGEFLSERRIIVIDAREVTSNE